MMLMIPPLPLPLPLLMLMLMIPLFIIPNVLLRADQKQIGSPCSIPCTVPDSGVIDAPRPPDISGLADDQMLFTYTPIEGRKDERRRLGQTASSQGRTLG